MQKQLYGIIYLVRSPSGKAYIGQTTLTLKFRRRLHRAKRPKEGCTALASAILKYGDSKMRWSVIASAWDKEGLDYAECALIAQHDTIVPNGYNLKDGGSNGKASAETCEKIRAAHKKRFADPDYLAEWTARTREEFASNPKRQKQLAKLNASRAKKPLWNKRQSDAMRTKWRDPSYRAQMSAALRKRPSEKSGMLL